MNRFEGTVGVFFSLTMAALLLTAVKALAEVVTNVRIPVNGAVFNPCNGETVTFNGVDHFTATVTLDGAGGFHIAFHDNIHVTASGSLGNEYVGNQEDNNEVNGRVGVEQTFALTFSEISKGSAPNFEVHMLLHITMNPVGTVTAFIDNFTSNCRG